MSDSYIEDEIDLAKIFFTLKSNIKKILLLTFSVTLITLLIVICRPNVYSSSTILSSESSSSKLGGNLGGLASLAGIDTSSDELDNFDYLKTIIYDKDFNYSLIKKYKLIEKLNSRKNYLYPLGLTFMRKLGKKDFKYDEMGYFTTYKQLLSMLSLSKNKKTSLINLGIISSDRILARELVDIYLKESINYLKKKDLKDLNKQITYYKDQLQITPIVELRTTISSVLSSLIQKKVLSDSSEFYLFKQITKPKISNVKEKTKPKRSLILIISFISSFILGCMLVLLRESFLRKNSF
ncbi:MAG: Unknown protein [uncultured Campylobacterales bacterium]|uniref:Polysaccharide chain length determinant N-terminal domain-containing protein n=1 Tax=uncultured Campylobacterales bacterium TaxID=352960 RepID=A0A6S6T2H8_9BACT|nr:MAG: Unknown protein [uncultured Campylobacterales bacterium]